MRKDPIIGFIGAGNMGEALIGGLLAAGVFRPGQLICADVRMERLEELKTRHGIQTAVNNLELIGRSDVVIYAVKPQIMAAVLNDTAPTLDRSKLVISIAAGVPLASIAHFSKMPLRVVRAMPNICVSVQAGATAIVAGSHLEPGDLAVAEKIFNAVGRCVVVPSENLLDAVTGLSGSGPAFAFVMMDALADAGVKMGLGRCEALLLAAQTLLGAAQMHLRTQRHPGQLKDQVASPGGTTIAGLHALDAGGVRAALINAVEAATSRARELGSPGPKAI